MTASSSDTAFGKRLPDSMARRLISTECTGVRRTREGWAALATLALVLVVLAYVLTSSVQMVFVVVLVLIVGLPALVMITFDRRSK